MKNETVQLAPDAQDAEIRTSLKAAGFPVDDTFEVIRARYSESELSRMGRGCSTDAIGIESKWAHEKGLKDGQMVAMYDPEMGVVIESRVKLLSGAIEEGSVSISPSHGDYVDADPNHQVMLLPYLSFDITTIKVQKFKNVGSNRVMLSPEDFELINKDYKYYQIVDNLTGCILYVNSNDFGADKTLKRQEARLSRYQRSLLRQDPPAVLPSAFVNHLDTCLEVSTEVAEAVRSFYQEDGELKEGLSFGEMKALTRYLKQAGYMNIQITPVVDSLGSRERKESVSKRIRNWFSGIFRRISDFYLGSQSKTLRCGRPYEFDESERVVRLSPQIMTLLGVEETDQVILKYGDKTANVRAMPIDDEDQFKATNIVGNGQSINYFAGIPAGVRSELGMQNIDVSVSVKRDTRFLLAKHTNIQAAAMFGLILTIVEMGFEPLLTVVVVILLTPVVLYAILSGERKRVS